MRRCSQELMRTQHQQADQKKFGRIEDVNYIYSIRRSKLYELIGSGLVKSAVIKQKGAKSGVRLIDMESVESFLRANTK
jgi:hypothetical protein